MSVILFDMNSDSADSRQLIAKPQRLYMVEFLRVWFILCVFILHVLSRYSQESNNALTYLFGTAKHNMGMSVECFFVIGGFFLYKRLTSDISPFELIKKTWLRLAPGLIFAFLVCVTFSKVRFAHLPAILFLAQGTGVSHPDVHILNCGDWFVGCYFWTTCLIIGIFQLPKRWAFPVLGILMYAFLIMFFDNPKWIANLTIQPRVGIVTTGMIRGIYSMGAGVFVAFLAQHIYLPQRWPAKIFGTAFEIWLLAALYICFYRPHHSHLGYWEVIAVMSLLLLSISQSWGYLSQLLNKCSHIQYVSRYVFPALVGHIIAMKLIDTYHKFGFGLAGGIIFVIGMSVVIGVIEYHLIEKMLIPKLRSYFLRKDDEHEKRDACPEVNDKAKEKVVQHVDKGMFLNHLAGLRGLAIILVVLFHLNSKAWSHGYLGVDVFLVMTGYLIFRGRLSHKENNTLKDEGLYLLKRIRRIVPPMVIIILLTAVVGVALLWWKDAWLLFKVGYAASMGKANMLLQKEFADYFATDSAFMPLLHLWYLSVTLQVYFMYVILNQLVQRLPKWAIIAVLFLVGVASLGYCYSFSIHAWLVKLGLPVWEQSKDVSYYQTLPRVWEVLAGGVACMLPSLKKHRVWATLLSLMALAGILVPALCPTVADAIPSTLVVVACAVMVIKYLPESMVCGLLSNKILVWLGSISFSLYLVHMPIIVYGHLWVFGVANQWYEAGLIAVSIAVAWGYWWAVEKRRFPWWVVLLLWGVTVAFCKIGRMTNGFKASVPSVALKLPSYELQMCRDKELLAHWPSIIRCDKSVFLFTRKTAPAQLGRVTPLFALGDATKKATVLLMGDSHASHMYAGVDHLFRQENLSGVYVANHVYPFQSWTNDHNVQKIDALLKWLDEHPELTHVIIAQRWINKYEGMKHWSGQAEVSVQKYAGDLRAFLQRVKGMGRHIMLIGPMPEYQIDSLEHYGKVLKRRHMRYDDITPVCTMEQFFKIHNKILPVLRQMEEEGLCTLIKPWETMKPGEGFSAVRNNTLQMWDRHHMYCSQAIWMTDLLKPQILRALNMGVVVEEAQVK